ncbi:ParM/StbA family protein [Clostridium botulinum D/C]|uniref:ParM/StbA family protein n=1 Tax=Clostridium botulinum TaxID=1491 RepID=UPI001E3BE1FF|nr:ParM/StbA family protein [Clostridium botulinum]MCD3240826.1 ParM/StbA family protein [Clostridium botulinum D/C]
MSNVIIAVDAGKNMLKAIGTKNSECEVKKVGFSSKYHITNDINEEIEGNSHIAKYEDKIYIIGDSGKAYDYDSNKEKDIHKISAYTAITQFIEQSTKDNHIYMVLACPIDFIRSKELKDSYKEFIKGSGEININIDGKDYNFIIEDITIKSEGSGVVYNNIELFKNEDVTVIDLGGVNFSFCIYSNCVAVKESRFARDFGGNYLIQLTRNALRDYTKGLPISENLALKSLIDDCLTLKNEKDSGSIEVIRKVKEEYLEKIIGEIKASGQNIDLNKPVFCGGTAELIRNVIKNKYKFATVLENPQWNSVEGLYVIAKNKYIDKLM